ncbi:MAG: hypothetical protein A2Z86_02750 [Candidatus Glassbacteria bacterium GWA2_58_10]|uniref:PpiC domain-containing protein n=1 Tax=Candidatus Glassbacteria bacterium GWA2_58_10 TaxID=1817865 RepID=A0A1F5YDF6_9BACT|nr:MAG: hypothetical protein A2Z86_02750 [Candidatus Glassbacteria bacterium GWA2_58_10]
MQKKLIAILLLCCSSAAAQQVGQRVILEDVAAVVGGEIILSSEVKMMAIQAAEERKIPMADTAGMRMLTDEVFQAEISNRVLLHQAREAKVEITDDEISQQVENLLNNLRNNYPSEQAFQRDLTAAGQTVEQLKEIYREQASNELLRQKFLQDHSHEFPRVKVTEEEARQFFDSQATGNSPEQVKYQYMIIAPKPGEAVLEEAKTKIDSVYKMYLDGTDFGYLAEKFSDDPTADKGGDLGFFSKGDMVIEFEEAAFSMKVGEVRMVQTKYGWHLIQVESRRQKEVKARHVLAATRITEDDWAKARELAESLRQRALNGEDFYKLAKENSEETTGLIESPNFTVLENIQPAEFKTALQGELTPVPNSNRRISGLVEMKPNGYLLMCELDRKEAAPLNFEDIRQQVIERLQYTKAIEAYVEELRKKTYIDIRFKGWSAVEAEQ